jgi:hypothetical protein
MKKEDVYTQWKAHRQNVPVPEHFASTVLAAIENRPPRGEEELPAALTDLSNRITRWGVAAGLVMLGLFRLVYIAVNLLRANPLMP